MPLAVLLIIGTECGYLLPPRRLQGRRVQTADFVSKQIAQLLCLHREVDEKAKQLKDVKIQLSQCNDAAQQGFL